MVALLLGFRQISPYGRMITASRRVAGRLFQIVTGIVKLRVENAEGSAFAIWARDYREQKRAEVEIGALEEHSRALGAALPYLATGVLLLALALAGDRNVPLGAFLVVYAVTIALQSDRRPALRILRYDRGHAAGVRPDAPAPLGSSRN